MSCKAAIIKLLPFAAFAVSMAANARIVTNDPRMLPTVRVIERIVFSGDGSRVAVISSTSKPDASKEGSVTIGDKTYGPFDEIDVEKTGDDLCVFYSDKTHTAYYQKTAARFKDIIAKALPMISKSEESPQIRKLAEEAKVLMDALKEAPRRRGIILKGNVDSNLVSNDFWTDSKDGKHLMISICTAGRPGKGAQEQCILDVDGVRYGPFDNSPQMATFSPDCKHIAFVVTGKNRMSLWLDKKIVAEHANIFDLEWRNNSMPDYRFQDSVQSLPDELKQRLIDNNRTALLILNKTPEERTAEVLDEFRKNANYYANGDTVIGPLFGSYGFKVSPDGKRVFCSRMEGYEKLYFVLDGKDYGPYKWISEPIFSGNSKRVAILVHADTDKNRLWVDGKLIQIPTDSGECDAPVFHCADQKLYYIVHTYEFFYVYLENKRIFGPCSGIEELKSGTKPGELSFSFYRRTDHEVSYFVYRNGSVLGPFTNKATVMEDHNHWAIITQSNGPAPLGVIVDGKKFGPYLNVAGFQFSNDGAHFSFEYAPAGASEKWDSLNIDGKNMPRLLEESTVLFSPDGKHTLVSGWVSTGERKRMMELLVDGSVAAKADFIGFCFLDNATLRIAEVKDQKISISDFGLDTGRRKTEVPSR